MTSPAASSSWSPASWRKFPAAQQPEWPDADALKKDLVEAKNLFVAQFQGMTVLQDTELRQKIRDTKSSYRVVKNTLTERAAGCVSSSGPSGFFRTRGLANSGNHRSIGSSRSA